MSADGFLNQKQSHPVAMAAAISINLAAVTAVMLAKSGVVVLPPDGIPLINITEPAEPEPVVEPPKPRVKTAAPPMHIPDPVVEPTPNVGGTTISGVDTVPSGGGGAGTVIQPRVEPPVLPLAMPVLTDAVPLPRAAQDFQPPYPSQLLRIGVEGKAVVRVLIGADGRVKQVAIISADDPLFADATERQALRKWRFKPATRDGVPTETWKQMTVRFEIRT